MYSKSDLKISGNEILVKEYSGTEMQGVKCFVWKNLITVNPQKCANLSSTMKILLISLY